MKWETLDIGIYQKEKQYIDTVIIPLVPVTWGKNMKQSATAGEFILILAKEIERQLKGRILLCPPFTYLETEPVSDRVQRLLAWEQEIQQNDVKFVYFITSDVEWKKTEDSFDWLSWFAAIPLDQMDKKYQETVIQDHVDMMLRSITEKWQLSNL